MHKPDGLYKLPISPEIRQVGHILSQDLRADEMHSILSGIQPQILRYILLRHRLFPAFFKKWMEVCDTTVLTPEWELFTIQIRQKTENNRMQMLQKTSTLLGVIDAFSKVQIPVLPLKGPVLACQLYGDVSMKASLDLDILIPKEYFTVAWQTLQLMGFTTEFNYELTSKQKKYLLNNFHHLSFLKDNTCIELHWEINTNKYMTGRPNTVYFEKAVPLTIGGKTVYTLHPDHLIEYLAIHGSYHAWYRLDWLYDFSQAVNSKQEAIPRISKNMHHAGLEIIFAQSISLSHVLFGDKLPDVTQKISPLLINIPLKEIGKTYQKAKFQSLSRITQKIYLLKLKKNWKYKIHVFSVLGTNQGNWKILRLPDRLFFLYFILRPLLYLIQITNAKAQSRKK